MNETNCFECTRIKNKEDFLSGIHSIWCKLPYIEKRRHYLKFYKLTGERKR
jgi:hypothetical protein